MNDNKSAFKSSEYDRKIKQTLPYYDEFYKQVVELVKTFHHNAVRWLDVGCGTGKMGDIAFENVELEKFVFCDSSDEMIRIVKERFECQKADFSVCDVKKMNYENEFDIITAIQVNHYLHKTERRIALRRCYEALKDKGVFISFCKIVHFGVSKYYGFPICKWFFGGLKKNLTISHKKAAEVPDSRGRKICGHTLKDEADIEVAAIIVIANDTEQRYILSLRTRISMIT